MGTVTNSFKGAFRIGQTMSVLGRAGVNWVRGDRPPTPRLLRQTFESLGATYIKLGQFIASSPTFFPKAYVEEFQNCLDRTPSLPYSVIRRIIRDELGRPIEEVFFGDRSSGAGIGLYCAGSPGETGHWRGSGDQGSEAGCRECSSD